MRSFFLLLAAFAIAPAGFAAAPDQVPAFSIDRNCSFEASAAYNVQQAKSRCKQEETNAKKQLAKQWSKFGAGAKRDCIRETTIGDEHSYVELQTCLQMSAEWTRTETVGQAQSNHGRNSRSR
jgi:hypothetical protein